MRHEQPAVQCTQRRREVQGTGQRRWCNAPGKAWCNAPDGREREVQCTEQSVVQCTVPRENGCNAPRRERVQCTERERERVQCTERKARRAARGEAQCAGRGESGKGGGANRHSPEDVFSTTRPESGSDEGEPTFREKYMLCPPYLAEGSPCLTLGLVGVSRHVRVADRR